MISSFTDIAICPLSDLPEGKTALLDELELAPHLAEHLMNLGFIPGIEVTVARNGPGGDPRIYRVDGAEVALRGELARCISVRHVPARAED